ncbi:MAG: trypsin-like serine protease, partial [Proteobacteria bacterium]|nr:trypsin-like serine protease [Pseudomonadota bacterium]
GEAEEAKDSRQQTADGRQEAAEEVVSYQPSDVVGATTGEMDVVEATTPIESLEPIPTVAFDYDTYYGEPEPFSTPPPPPVETQSADTGSKDHKGLMFLGAFAAGILGAALTVGVLAATGSFSDAESTTSTTVANTASSAVTTAPQVTNQIINGVGSSVNPSAVALKVVPSVVTVNVFDQTDSDPGSLIGTGSGSGVVMSDEGFIITNNHVVEGSTNYSVIFEDGRSYEAELIGTDPLTDLAVLKISADNLVPVEFGSTDDLIIGDPAVAVGNPLGQDGGSSVSVGIVSAFDRTVEFGDDSRLFGMLQTDAAINSGSSGGALVDAEGKLIGITSAIGVSQAGPEGIGYAIPIELVDRITAEIIETGDVDHPFLGVTIGTFLEEAPDGAITPAGSDIQSITDSESAAGDAGLLPGDVVIRIGDKDIVDQTDLILAVRLHRVGDEVEFEALRDGESMTFAVVMGQRPEEFGG